VVSNSVNLGGVIAADAGNVKLSTNSYTATLGSAGTNSGITVTVAGMTLTGTAAANYTLTQPSGLTANITPATVMTAAAMPINTCREASASPAIAHPGSDMRPFAIARSRPYVTPNSRIAAATMAVGTTQSVVRRASRRHGVSRGRRSPEPQTVMLFVIAGLTYPVRIHADQSSRLACVTVHRTPQRMPGASSGGFTNSQRADAKNGRDPW